MKPKFHPIIATALLLLTTLNGRAEKQIQIEMFDNEAEPVVVEAAKISKIKFNTTTFNLEFHNEVTADVYDYAQVKRISFKEAVATNIDYVGVVHPLKVSPNPVQDNLHFLGGEELYGADVNIYSTTGVHVMCVTNWSGDAINVSHLNSGVYIVNIKTTTIKFIKL